MILMQMLSFADGRYTGHDIPTEPRRDKKVICLDWLITELSLRNATKCNTSRSRRKSLECSTPTVAYIFTAVEIRLLEYQLF